MKVKTTPTTQSRRVERGVCKAFNGTHQISNFFIVLDFGRFSSDLILFAISSQTFGAKYDKDSMP